MSIISSAAQLIWSPDVVNTGRSPKTKTQASDLGMFLFVIFYVYPLLSRRYFTQT